MGTTDRPGSKGDSTPTGPSSLEPSPGHRPGDNHPRPGDSQPATSRPLPSGQFLASRDSGRFDVRLPFEGQGRFDRRDSSMDPGPSVADTDALIASDPFADDPRMERVTWVGPSRLVTVEEWAALTGSSLAIPSWKIHDTDTSGSPATGTPTGGTATGGTTAGIATGGTNEDGTPMGTTTAGIATGGTDPGGTPTGGANGADSAVAGGVGPVGDGRAVTGLAGFPAVVPAVVPVVGDAAMASRLAVVRAAVPDLPKAPRPGNPAPVP